MDISTLTRSPDEVLKTVVETKNNQLVTKTGCKIYVPTRYASKQLLILADDIYILGFAGIVTPNNYYATMAVMAMVNIDPDSTKKVKIGDSDYYEFTFNKGSRVIKTLDLVKNDDLPFTIYDYFIAYGNVPWYMNYLNTLKLFETNNKHTGAFLASSPNVLALMAATICHDPGNVTELFRMSVNTLSDAVARTPDYIGLKNIKYGGRSVVTKLMNGYFEDNITSGLVSTSNKLEKMEAFLRI